MWVKLVVLASMLLVGGGPWCRTHPVRFLCASGGAGQRTGRPADASPEAIELCVKLARAVQEGLDPSLASKLSKAMKIAS